MWWIIVALLAAMSTPATSTRGLAPVPEPEQKAVFAAPIERVYLPIVQTHTPLIEGADTTLYGYSTPHRRAYNVPFYNWRAIVEDCENKHFWPMVRGQAVDPDMVDACDNGQRWLLIYNEPELDHFSATPAEAAVFVRDWADRWTGPVACCGNFYHISGGRDGLDWFLDFLAESGDNPQIDAIHLHVYAWLSVDVGRLHAWRTVADVHGWPIHVTEAGIFTSRDYPPDEVAAALPGTANVFTAAQTINDNLVVDTDALFVDAISNRVGIGIATPAHKLHVSGSSSSIKIESTGALTNTFAEITGVSSGRVRLGATGSTTNNRNFEFTSRDDSLQFSSLNDNWSSYLSQYIMVLLAGGNVGIGTTSPSAQLHVDQSSAAGAKPTLRLRQAALTEEFIRFDTTVGAGNPINTTALGTYYGRVRVWVEGVGAKWLALYNT